MVHQLLLIITLLSIWLSLTMAMVTLFGAVHFWLKNSTEEVAITPLSRYPTISIVVPAHNEDVVIAQTMSALLNLNYPADKVELLLYSDNSDDHTADEMRRVQQLPEYRNRNIVIVERTGKGGKAGVLNDSLEIATGEYIAVYDADAMPERNALYFLVRKALEDPERHVA
ncbi:MAG: glycosyltransferase, partial [Weissella cibaria]